VAAERPRGTNGSMALSLADKWLWDFWLVEDGPDYHVFYLQAPRSLSSADLRHYHPSIGHAVSQDLRRWEVLPDALSPRPTTSWDDYTTWTGSIIRHEGLWYMFYTGTSRAEEGLVQRIGIATSTDLLRWERHGEHPRLWCVAGQWYESLDTTRWRDEAWRDPWIFHDPITGGFHAYFTARASFGPDDGRGVIGHARSRDLLDWELLPPVTDPGDFGELEIPQLAEIENRFYLFYSTLAHAYSASRRARVTGPAVSGTHYYVSDGPFGPFRGLTDEFLVGDTVGSYYGGKAIRERNGTWSMMLWRWLAPDGSFRGDLTDPLPLHVASDGRLTLDPGVRG
jgi:beta-fructofuranosidase